MITLFNLGISLIGNGGDEDRGYDEADQYIAGIISAKEGIDERLGNGWCSRGAQRMNNAQHGNNDQDKCQERRQIFPHTVHNPILIKGKEKGNEKIQDDERNKGRGRNISLNTQLNGRGTGAGNGNKGTYQHESGQQDVIGVLAHMISDGMDIAIKTYDDKSENREKYTGQGESHQTGKERRTAV